MHPAAEAGGDLGGTPGCGGVKSRGGKGSRLAGALCRGVLKGDASEVYDGRDSSGGDAGRSFAEAV